MSIYDSKQKRLPLHTSERTIVPRTVIFCNKYFWPFWSKMAIFVYRHPQTWLNIKFHIWGGPVPVLVKKKRTVG